MRREITEEQRVGLNVPAVACQVIEGEALVIHFSHGHYFSAAGSGARILQMLAERPASALELAAALGGTEVAHVVAVRGFLERLTDEEVVVATDGTPGEPLERVASGAFGVRDDGFDEPRLEKHTDLEDLLILDPIHEVMATGWPAR